MLVQLSCTFLSDIGSFSDASVLRTIFPPTEILGSFLKLDDTRFYFFMNFWFSLLIHKYMVGYHLRWVRYRRKSTFGAIRILTQNTNSSHHMLD